MNDRGLQGCGLRQMMLSGEGLLSPMFDLICVAPADHEDRGIPCVWKPYQDWLRLEGPFALRWKVDPVWPGEVIVTVATISHAHALERDWLDRVMTDRQEAA